MHVMMIHVAAHTLSIPKHVVKVKVAELELLCLSLILKHLIADCFHTQLVIGFFLRMVIESFQKIYEPPSPKPKPRWHKQQISTTYSDVKR